MNRGPVKIHNYDSVWSIQFERFRQQLKDTLGDSAIQIEHIGSTAVEGLGAKPIIDILITVSDVEVADNLIPSITDLGYTYVDKHEDELPFRRYFVLFDGTQHKVHLHVVPHDHEFAKDHLNFRDYLRDHPDVKDEYHLLKTRLANKYREDREGYQKAKAEFIESVIEMSSEYFKDD